MTPKSPTPNPQLEAALAPFLQRPLNFVSVGASDGVGSDPIHPFILEYGWRGVLVEPVPHVFRQLVDNYRGVEGLCFEQVVVGSHPVTFHHMPEAYCARHPWARQVGSTDIERVRWILAILAKNRSFDGVEFADVERIESSDFPVASFDEIVARNGLRRVDLVNIDAEGMDFEILRTIDLDRYETRVVIIETQPKFHDDQIGRWLSERGFRLAARVDWATDAFIRG